MNLHDLLDTEEDKAQREAMANAAGEVIDSMDDPVGAQKTLFVCSLCVAGIYGLAFFAPYWIAALEFEYQIFLYLTLFACGFLIGFALFRLYQFYFVRRRELNNIASGVMGGYEYYSQQNRRWKIWVVAATAAVFNVIAFNVFLSVFYR
jgi:hypothetical protein